MKILMQISFVGTNYCGWQKQKNNLSVQEALTNAAGELFGFPCDITGCSRTDSGVHANGFCATVAKKGEKGIETTVPLCKLPRAMNNFLPDDISVISARAVEDDFHPRYDVAYKEYVYLIYDRRERDPFLSGRVWHIPHRFDDDAIERMNEAATSLIGKHDFASFMAAGSKIEDTVRCIKHANVTRDGKLIKLSIAADGFLSNMVRIIMGTLVEIGEGKRSVKEMPEITEKKDRRTAGRTAPADGLYLNEVIYDK